MPKSYDIRVDIETDAIELTADQCTALGLDDPVSLGANIMRIHASTIRKAFGKCALDRNCDLRFHLEQSREGGYTVAASCYGCPNPNVVQDSVRSVLEKSDS